MTSSAEAVQEPVPVTLGSEELFELATRLRAAEISATPDQLSAAIDLVFRLRLTEREDVPRALADYRALLAPIFCRSPEEQEIFHDLYAKWAGEKAVARGRAEESPAAGVLPPASPRPSERFPWRGLIIVAAVAGFFIFRQLDPGPEPGPVTSPSSPTISPTAEARVATPSPLPIAEDIYAAVVPPPPEAVEASLALPGGLDLTAEGVRIATIPLTVLAFAGWLAWTISRRRILLERRPADGGETPKLHVVRVKGSDARLFTRQQLRPTIDRLRTPVRTTTPNIDMPRTIEATLRANGLFTAVYRRRRRLPEYVVLIDRAHPRDHLSAFAFEMIERLRRENLSVYAYFFYGDPRRCQVYDAIYATVHLDEIEAQHGGARLVLISDCAGLFSPLSGKPERWVSQLQRWPERVVMTPQPAQRWGYAELSLCLAGFLVAPLSSEGLSLVSERFVARTLDSEDEDEGGVLIGSARGASIMPRIIEQHFDAWVERQPPLGADVQVLLSSLRRYLGADGMRVLAAAAVYPELTWPLLLFLDWRLVPAQGTDTAREERLFDLARLPWCRHAQIPDYLRVLLIRTLSDGEQQLVRDLFRSLFDSALVDGATSLELTIAEPPSKKRWSELVRQWFTRRRDDTRDPDYIYPKVLLSGRPGMLDFELPRRLISMFPGARWHRVAAASVGALAIAVFLGAVAWVTFALARPAVESQLAAAVRSRNADYPIRIWHPVEQEATAQALVLTLKEWGFPVTHMTVWDASAGDRQSPVVVYGQDDGDRTAEWLAARLSYIVYGRPTVLDRVDGARASQSSLGIPDSRDYITVQPEPGARIFLMRRLFEQSTPAGPRPAGTAVSFQDRLAKGSLGPIMTIVLPGSFSFGASDGLREVGVTPAVTIERPFAISQREVTVDEFARFVDATGYRTVAEMDDVPENLPAGSSCGLRRNTWWRSPGFRQNGTHPVVCVAWSDAQAYAAWLTDRTGETYRLPTEAEWEYAARGGDLTSARPWEDPSEACRYANVRDAGSLGSGARGAYPCDDGARETAPVARYEPNAFGLYDMLGNVSEWVHDCWEDSHDNAPTDGSALETADCSDRVIRGMDARTTASDDVDVTNRAGSDGSGPEIGFRLARVLTTQPVPQAATAE